MDVLGFERWEELLVPADVLVADKNFDAFGEAVEALLLGDAIVYWADGLVVAVFNALQDSGHADFDEFVEVAGGDGEELYALKERIGVVLGFFKDAAVEAQP